jgi:hypothetical protein
VILVDADAPVGEEREARLRLEAADVGLSIPVIAIPPTLEEGWLGVDRRELPVAKDRRLFLRERAETVSLSELTERAPAFRRFAALLDGSADVDAEMPTILESLSRPRHR